MWIGQETLELLEPTRQDELLLMVPEQVQQTR